MQDDEVHLQWQSTRDYHVKVLFWFEFNIEHLIPYVIGEWIHCVCMVRFVKQVRPYLSG